MYTKMFSMTMLLILLITACSPAAPANLQGTSWQLVSYGPSSNPTAALPDGQASITFNEDGRVNGSLGCNSVSAEYKITGEKITFGPMMMTLMACPEPQMLQESTASSILSGEVSFEVTSNKLTITSSDGNNVLTFDRIEK
jgi:heat shock protein HslJ